MIYIRPDEWQPSENIRLEENAKVVLRSTTNYAVIAGPGAGKTELLAQRAAYLLQTNLCSSPAMILAISFKHDAASNLRDRVRLRCGEQLASRFVSLTFDAFAKNLLDRFRAALPEDYRVPADYDIVTLDSDFYDYIGQIKTSLRPPAELGGMGLLHALRVREFVSKHLCAASINPEVPPQSVIEWGARQVWQRLVNADKCAITFDMVKRLAEYLLEQNPLLLRALRMTYSHIFLDEFQDTTNVQYDLLLACFEDTNTVITAVGDNKQSIMRWANALHNGFDMFEKDFSASKLQLMCNHRSDSELVRIQQHLMSAIDPNCDPTEASERNQIGDGICQVLVFETDSSEATYVSQLITDLIKEGVAPTDICLLAHIKPENYAREVIERLSDLGIKCRVENDYQDLIKEEVVKAILAILHLVFENRSPQNWQMALNLSLILKSIDTEDAAAIYGEEERLSGFIAKLRRELVSKLADESALTALVQQIIRFFGIRSLRYAFPQYRNQKTFSYVLKNFVRLFWKSYVAVDSWNEALADFEGIDTVPAMTVHKSKGLEYHTVFFLGLEDEAWKQFADQKEEDTCAFFVAFSRAEKAVYFTFCESRALSNPQQPSKQYRKGIVSLYDLLMNAEVEEHIIQTTENE